MREKSKSRSNLKVDQYNVKHRNSILFIVLSANKIMNVQSGGERLKLIMQIVVGKLNQCGMRQAPGGGMR